MICKGTTHNNGAKLAAYLTTGKDGERAELWQLCGFAAKDIRDAFRDVHVMADATRCSAPFFHVQIRNREGEVLTRQEWEQVANRIETKLGLTGQPRAIAFHTNEKTRHEHMHVVFSRIEEDSLKARPLPFFKLRLKETARELEMEMGLERVKNERDGPISYAPTRAQEEQARRLGIDIHEVRATIHNCWDRSDNGRSFQAALSEHDLLLAQGQRRDFLVIDQQGGMHALGKRILGVTAAQTRARMQDLDREKLPTVEKARELQIERQQTRAKTTDISRVLSRAKEMPRPIERPEARIPVRQQWLAVGKEQGLAAQSYGAGRAKNGFRKPSKIAGKALDAFANAFESLFAPVQTPEQKHEAAHATREREAQADKTIDLARFLADRRTEKAQQTQEGEKQRQRDRGGREI